MKNFSLLSVLFAGTLAISGCSASYHAADTQKGVQGDRLTVGTVQREIKNGMSGAEVVQALGSPNILSTDELGREVWIYDKISSDRVSSSGGLFISTGASSTSQSTLTIVIKFDTDHKVREFAYHTSRF